MSRLVAFLGRGNIPVFLFEVAKETPQRFYGKLIERVDGKDNNWWYIRGYVHSHGKDKSYIGKALTVPVANRASWDQCLPVMQHAIEAKNLELDRLLKERREFQDRLGAAEVKAKLLCSETCLMELRKDV